MTGDVAPKRVTVVSETSLLQTVTASSLDPVDAPDGAGVSSDDDRAKYRVERHPNGRVTFHRRDRKLSKAEKKALKRRRQHG